MTDAMAQEVLSLAESKSIELNKEQYEKDARRIRAWIKSQIARNLFGNEGRFHVLLSEDNQFLKAITLFPEAEKIAGIR